jgi:hypothetical protein
MLIKTRIATAQRRPVAILKQFEEFALQWHKEKDKADCVADSNTIGAHAHDTAIITSRQQEQQELEDAPRKGHVRFTDQELLHHLGSNNYHMNTKTVSMI